MPQRSPSPASRDSKPQWQLVPWGSDVLKLPLDRAGHSTTVVGSKLYVAAGRKGSSFFQDVHVFDTRRGSWSRPAPPFPFRARANHTATLVGGCIWFVAGSDAEDVLGDVFVLELATHTWHAVPIMSELLFRTAHAAEVHPCLPATLLIMGGYAPLASSAAGALGQQQQPFDMTNDLLLLHTDTHHVERVAVFSSLPPAPRAYHSLTVVGDKAYVFGGRSMSGVISGPSLLAVYDTLNNAWACPTAVAGAPPSPRSSHRAVAYQGRIILYGGAGEGAAGKERMNDVHSLVLLQGGQQLCWSRCDSPEPSEATLQGRSAHTMNLVGNVLYVLCGYAGVSCNKYARDCWSLRLVPDAFTRWHPRAAAAAQETPLPLIQEQQQQQLGSKRSAADTTTTAAAAAAAPAGGGGNGSGWRVTKRQRSGGGGSGGTVQQQQQQQQQQARQQQQQPPPQQQQQPQQQAQQQQQQQPRTASPQHEMVAAAAAAAVAALHAAGSAHGGCYNPGVSCPPSPNNYQAEYLKQELDQLREQYQQCCGHTSSLEGQNRLLRQQLADTKQEARSDKAGLESALQAAQAEALRHKLAADQALVHQQREQEHSATLQQQLDAVAAKAGRAEREWQQQREQLAAQLQVLQSEARQAGQLLAERDKERSALGEQLSQQHEKQARLEEQLERERQQNLELRAHCDQVCEEKRRCEAALNQSRVEAVAKDAQLQERANKLRDLQQQLDGARQSCAEQSRQSEAYMKMQQDTHHELQALQQTHKGLQVERQRLQEEVAKLREEVEKGRADLSKAEQREQNAKAALLQIQGGYTAALNALNGR